MPAAKITTRREAARRATQHQAGLATRERLRAVAWAAHESGERPAPRELARRLGISVQTMHRHARALKDSGRWPWAADADLSEADRRAFAVELVARPRVRSKLGRVVAVASSIAPELADEFEACAWAALWEIALDYRPDSPMPWERYAAVRLRLAVTDCHRSWYGRRREKVVVRSLTEWDDRPDETGIYMRLGDTIPADELPVGWELDSQDHFDHLVGGLYHGYRRAVREAYLMCSRGPRESAERLGMTPSGMRWNVRAALEAMRMEVESHE